MKLKKDIEKNMIKCPIDHTYDLVGKKFVIHILRNMIFYHQSRFNQLLNSILDINPRILSNRLREMEKDGLIQRVIYDDIPVRVEYQITEKGRKTQPILEQMAIFSLRHCSTEIFKDKKPRTFKQVFGITPTIAR